MIGKITQPGQSACYRKNGNLEQEDGSGAWPNETMNVWKMTGLLYSGTCNSGTRRCVSLGLLALASLLVGVSSTFWNARAGCPPEITLSALPFDVYASGQNVLPAGATGIQSATQEVVANSPLGGPQEQKETFPDAVSEEARSPVPKPEAPKTPFADLGETSGSDGPISESTLPLAVTVPVVSQVPTSSPSSSEGKEGTTQLEAESSAQNALASGSEALAPPAQGGATQGVGGDYPAVATPFAGGRQQAGDIRQSVWLRLLVVVLVLVLGLGLARVLAVQWRLPEFESRLAIVLLSFFGAVAIVVMGWPPRQGIDLRGGVILVYEIEDRPVETSAGTEEVGPAQVDMDKLVQAISRRVNPGGVLEVTIRPLGENQLEVIIPEADREEVERIKRKISSAGTLEFRILANNRDHQALIEQALAREDKVLRDAEGNILAWWVPIARGQEGNFPYPEIATRKRVDPKTKYEFTEVLVVKDPFDVTGGYLVHAAPGFDRTGSPAVFFTFNSEGGMRFGGLTGNNLPEAGQVEFTRKLGIILDGYLYSAPAIRDTIFTHGEITGRFTREEVQDLVDVLNAGSLPARLSEQPVSELVIGPTLGRDTVRRSIWAMLVSAVLVCAFMITYYRFGGLVACWGLLQTVLLILALMISIRAAFTLPGFAGLVLTLGMAVDANVLIYERIREELEKGASLRMAIRNGFDRARSAIVDANLTTLITATVLYVIGRDQIRGFAVTLWLGVVVSMFAMLYSCRVIIELAERLRWITRLSMLRLIGTPNISFMQKSPVAVGISLALIVLGLIAVFARGKGLLDIDFTGGVSIEVEFIEPQDIGQLRAKLSSPEVGLMDLAISDVRRLDDPVPGRHFIINTSGVRGMDPNAPPSEVFAEVQRRLKEVFGKQLAHYSLSYTIITEGQASSRKVPGGKAESPNGSVPKTGLAVKPGDFRWHGILALTLPTLAAGGETGTSAKDGIEVGENSQVTPEKSHQGVQAVINPPSYVAKEESAVLDDSSQEAGFTANVGSTGGEFAGKAPGGSEPSLDSTAGAEMPTTLDSPASPPEASSTVVPVLPSKEEEKDSAIEPAASESPAVEARPRDEGWTRARISFDQPVVYETVDQLISAALEQERQLGRIDRFIPYRIFRVGPEMEAESAGTDWEIELELPGPLAREVLDLIAQRVNDTPYFPSINTVGGAVAAGTRIVGIAAVLSSLVFIIAYIWARFQRIIFGIAAVVALVHDVLITLGAIAGSAFLANWLGFLLISEFKISLSVLAAFLTIIGYSLNDTIVVFDRIREVKGRAPRLTPEMVDQSINQTLSRSILTSLTTLLVVMVLYVGGGQAIHAFAFSIMVGVLVGTYSSIFIASPLLVWATKLEERRKARARVSTAKA